MKYITIIIFFVSIWYHPIKAQPFPSLDTISTVKPNEETQCLLEWSLLGLSDLLKTSIDSIELQPTGLILQNKNRYLVMLSSKRKGNNYNFFSYSYVELLKPANKSCISSSVTVVKSFYPETSSFQAGIMRYYQGFFDQYDMINRGSMNVLMGDGSWKRMTNRGMFGKPLSKEDKNTFLHSFGTLKKVQNGFELTSRKAPSLKVKYDSISTLAPKYFDVRYSVFVSNQLQGLLDSELKIAVQPNYEWIDIYRSKVVIGKTGDYVVIIDPKSGKELTPHEYTFMTFDTDDNYLIATRKRKKEKVKLDLKGNLISE